MWVGSLRLYVIVLYYIIVLYRILLQRTFIYVYIVAHDVGASRESVLFYSEFAGNMLRTI